MNRIQEASCSGGAESCVIVAPSSVARNRAPGGVDRFSYMARTDSSSRDAGIEVNGLVRRFKDVEAVAGIDLTIRPGEIYGFLGPNGAGKSTTVHMLTTLLPPSAGSATVAGFDVARQGPEVRRRIGAALQEAALDAFRTGRDHFELQGGFHGLPRDEPRAPQKEL